MPSTRPKRKTIYYNGIGSSYRQFYSLKEFYELIRESRDIQAIIRKFGGAQYFELDLKTICAVMGAAVM